MTQENEIISSITAHEVHLPEGSHTAIHKTASAMEPQIRNTMANPNEVTELAEVVKGVTHNETDKTLLKPLTALQQETDRMANFSSAEEAERVAHIQESQAQVLADQFVSVHTPEADEHNVHDTSAEPPDHRVSGEPNASTAITKDSAAPLHQVMQDLPSLELDGQAPAAPESAGSSTPAQEVPNATDTPDEAASLTPPPSFMEEMNFPARVVKLKIINDQIRGEIEKLEKPLFDPIPVEAPAAKGKEKKEAAKKSAKGH